MILLVSCGGGSSSNSTSIPESQTTYSGAAQKGPFASGSNVVITEIDSFGNSVGESIQTKVSDKSGKFSYKTSSDTSKSYYRMQVVGNSFNEHEGTLSDNSITLNAISKNPNSSINVLTHWISNRIDVLLASGKTLRSSSEQSEKELINIFGINNVNSLDITSNSNTLKEDNAMLLVLSGALMEASSRYQVSPQIIIDEIGFDFADDGQISDKGDDWFIRLQSLIKNNPHFQAKQYSKNIREALGYNIEADKKLPEIIPLASRPVANVPPELLAEPSETITLDGSASNDNGDVINFTWFRVDQQTQYDIQVSDRFSATPTITLPDKATVLAAPNQEISLLYALVVTDVDKLTHTGVVKVTVRIPPEINNPPVAESQNLITDEDTPIAIRLAATDPDGDLINFVLSTPLSTSNGIIELDTTQGTSLPNVIYTPTPNYFGSDSFTFIVNDGFANSNTAIVDIQVNPVNDPPIADAGIDQTAESLEIITLDGSGSSDIDGTVDVYTWEQISGLLVSLNNTNISNRSFTAPDVVSVPETLTFNLLVTDNDGADSVVDTVVITINPPNEPPVANAGLDQLNAISGELITLDGSGSDIDGSIEAYSWAQNGTPTVILSDDSIANPSFTGPPVSSTAITLTFDLTVTDDDGATSIVDSVDIVINPTTATNLPPNAIATFNGNQPFVELTEVELIGGESSDTDGNIVSYGWQQIGTPAVSLSDTNIANPTFTAPSVSTTPLILTFNLTVTDNDGATDSDTVIIEVVDTGNTRPNADAGSNDTVTRFRQDLGGGSIKSAIISLDGSASNDIEDQNTELSYQWIQQSGPISISASEIPQTIQPSFAISSVVATISGDYVFRLLVTDTGGLVSEPDDVTITVRPPIPPTAQDITQNIRSGVIPLTLIGDDPDGDNTNLEYDIRSLPTFGRLFVGGIRIDAVGPIVGNGIEYESNSISSPDPDTFNYRVTDEQGLISSTATVNLTQCVPNRPSATAGENRDVFTGTEVTLIGNGLADPSCDDGDNINFLDFNGFSWTYVSSVPNTVAPSDVILNTSNPNSNRTPTFTAPFVTEITTLTFELIVRDSSAVPELSEPATMTVTVYPTGSTLPPNLPPTTSIYNVEVLANGASVPIDIREQDPDGDNEGLTYAVVDDPVNGSITQIDPSAGAIRYWYTPNGLPVAASDSFTFTATDQDGLSTPPITVNISRIVEPSSNLAPVLNDQSITLSPFTDFSNRLHIFQFTRDVIIIDEDPNDIRYIEVSRDESNGVDFIFQSNGFLRADNSNRSTPASGEFVLKAIDKYGRESATATFTIQFTN